MEFQLSEDLSLLQNTVREFVAKEVAPSAAERDKSGEFPAENTTDCADEMS